MGYEHSSSHSSSDLSDSSSEDDMCNDELFQEIRDAALEVEKMEVLLEPLLRNTVLHPRSVCLASMVARTVVYRLFRSSAGGAYSQYEKLVEMFINSMESNELELGSTMLEAVRHDLIACVNRDPACESALEVLLYYKGFASLVVHRAARRNWLKEIPPKGGSSLSEKILASHGTSLSKHLSLWLQSLTSAAFGVDIHPAAEIGAGVVIDHATGLVIGETATVGNNCTFLHGVTLGGTGKEHFDRHPKVGHNVLIGAGASVLGNIRIGDCSKIGAASVVLKSIPSGCTAVGSPARIIGFAERKPGKSVDSALSDIVPIQNLTQDDEDDVQGETGTETTARSTSDSSIDTITDLPQQKMKSLSIEQRHSGKTWNKDSFRCFPCKDLPNGAISIKCLNKLLSNHCSEDEIGEIYISLLKLEKPCLGYVKGSTFTQHFAEVAAKHTELNTHQCQDIASTALHLSTNKKK